MNKIRFGVIGLSKVAQKNMLPAICDSNFAELKIVGSRSAEKGKEIASQFDCNSFGSYEDVLDSKEVDAVYISLPPSMHEEWMIRSAEKGKHILCEKPAATSFAAAKKVYETVEKSNVRLLEGLMFRFHPQHKRVKELMDAGVVGNILRVEACFGYAMPEKDSNAMKRELGGGSLSACGTYPIYASRMIFGEEPEAVFSRFIIDPESGVDVRNDILLNYSNGRTATTSSIFGSYYQSSYGILGSNAYVRLLRAYAVPRDMKTRILIDKDDKISEVEIEPADHFRLMVDEFSEEIMKGSESKKNYEIDFLNQARVYEAAVRSNAEKREVLLSEIK